MSSTPNNLLSNGVSIINGSYNLKSPNYSNYSAISNIGSSVGIGLSMTDALLYHTTSATVFSPDYAKASDVLGRAGLFIGVAVDGAGLIYGAINENTEQMGSSASALTGGAVGATLGTFVAPAIGTAGGYFLGSAIGSAIYNNSNKLPGYVNNPLASIDAQNPGVDYLTGESIYPDSSAIPANPFAANLAAGVMYNFPSDAPAAIDSQLSDSSDAGAGQYNISPFGLSDPSIRGVAIDKIFSKTSGNYEGTLQIPASMQVNNPGGAYSTPASDTSVGSGGTGGSFNISVTVTNDDGAPPANYGDPSTGSFGGYAYTGVGAGTSTGTGNSSYYNGQEINQPETSTSLPDEIDGYIDSPEYGQCEYGDPLVLNLQGGPVDTVESAASPARFDMRNDGAAVQTGWGTAGEGYLVNTADGKTTVTDAADLMPSFAALRALDSNHDDVLDSKDAQWTDLKVWVDGTGTGTFQPGSLRSLDDLGITSINLDPTADQQRQNGNIILADGTFTKRDGSIGQIDDVAFQIAPDLSLPTQAGAMDAAARAQIATQVSQLVSAMSTFGTGSAADTAMPGLDRSIHIPLAVDPTLPSQRRAA